MKTGTTVVVVIGGEQEVAKITGKRKKDGRDQVQVQVLDDGAFRYWVDGGNVVRRVFLTHPPAGAAQPRPLEEQPMFNAVILACALALLYAGAAPAALLCAAAWALVVLGDRLLDSQAAPDAV